MELVQPTCPSHRPRNDLRTGWLYFRAILSEFRWTLAALGAAISVGALLYRITPCEAYHGRCPSVLQSFHAAWMAMLSQPVCTPETWYMVVLQIVYPLLGFILIGEGVVRLAWLMLSKRHGEKEWMRVMASTYRDHVVLCGLGHLGFRVLEQLAAEKTPVVAIEKAADGRFMAQARALGVPILVRDMKEDQALVDAGVLHARSIIIATNDDMANLEVALDARRLKPDIRVIMRLFDQQIAAKISGAFMVDVAFSASALAAPMVAAMSLEARVLSTSVIAGIPHVACEITLEGSSALAGQSVAEVERTQQVRILARTPRGAAVESPPDPDAVLAGGDVLVVHAQASRLAAVSMAARRTAETVSV